VKLLSRILEKGSSGQKLLALDHLSEVKIKSAVGTLVEFLKQSDNELRKRAIECLQALVGKSPGQSVESVERWWKEHQNDDEKDLFAPSTDSATGVETGTAADHLDSVRYVVFDRLRRLPKDKIIVISSDCKGCEDTAKKMPPEWDHNFDHIERILERMQIPHVVVKKSAFDTESFKLDDKVAVIMNCNQFQEHCVCPTCQASNQAGGWRLVTCTGCEKHIPWQNMMSQKGVNKIKDFVANGGYFFSEDAVLEEVLVRIYKDIIGFSKRYSGEKNVTILPAPGNTTHPYLKGVFEKPAAGKGHPGEPPADGDGDGTLAVKKRELTVGEGKWKIDDQSPDIKINKPQDVTILMVSSDLKTSDKDSGAVAITFSCGKTGLVPRLTGGDSDNYSLQKKTGGQVMHVLSHFGHQQQATDEFVLQNLILNFLMEAAERYGMQPKK